MAVHRMKGPTRISDEEVPVIAAVSVAVLREGRVLLVLRGRAPSRGLYAFPGGRAEAGESLEDAARRELMEETGLAATHLAPIDRLRFATPQSVFDLQVFVGTVEEGEAIAGDDAAELGWFAVAEMDRLPMTESTLVIARRLLGA